MGERLDIGNKPWDGYTAARQSLVKPMKVLGFDPKGER
jgi:hypothetical protein